MRKTFDVDAVLTEDVTEADFIGFAKSFDGVLLYYSRATCPPTVLVRFRSNDRAEQFKAHPSIIPMK